MIKVVKLNAEYDIEEKDLSLWLSKGFKKADELKPKQILEENDEPTLEELKKMADKLEIEYAPNIGYAKLLQKINAKKAE